jgi:hypothetical protein
MHPPGGPAGGSVVEAASFREVLKDLLKKYEEPEKTGSDPCWYRAMLRKPKRCF